jgi:MoaA/NifB/PqqE/SkfB family radical SAM enzyme
LSVRQVKFAQIEPTTRCNFTCRFCCGRHMRQGDLSLAAFEQILDTFPELEHIELQGEGEPLLHPGLFEMVERARGRSIRVSFITNGSLFSDENVERILALGIERVMVSFESARAERFVELRGGILEKVIAGLQRLLAARRRAAAALPVVGLCVTLMRSTIEEVAGLIALYRQLELDGGITFQELQRRTFYTASYSPELVADILSFADSPALVERLRGDPELIQIRTTRKRNGFYDQLFAATDPHACPWLERGIYVNIDGSATACCTIKDSARHALGTIGRDPREALMEARAQTARELARGRIPDSCLECPIAERIVASEGDAAP